MRRRVSFVMALVGVPIAFLLLTPGAAAAAPAPTSIQIEGPGLDTAINVRAQSNQDLFADLLNEVNWLATRPGSAPTPGANYQLGPKYVLVVRLDEKPDQTYDLYPTASGGPRVFRPDKQPNGKKTAAAWFYGRLSMPDTLRAAGAPLESTNTRELNGGRGGGEVVQPGAVRSTPPDKDGIQALFGQWQRSVLAAGAVAIVMLVGLAGFARLVRKY